MDLRFGYYPEEEWPKEPSPKEIERRKKYAQREAAKRKREEETHRRRNEKIGHARPNDHKARCWTRGHGTYRAKQHTLPDELNLDDEGVEFDKFAEASLELYFADEEEKLDLSRQEEQEAEWY